jgi:ABC-type dipeptide/oligopeptide/nickel transport system ATPase subunit
MRSVSFERQPGETLGIVGESGSGKSTTGAVALGLQRPGSGRVLFEGEQFPRHARERAGRIQAVLRHPHWSLAPRMRVGHRAHRDSVVAMLDDVWLAPDLAEPVVRRRRPNRC